MSRLLTRAQKKKIEEIEIENALLQEEFIEALLLENNLSIEEDRDKILDRWNRFCIRKRLGHQYARWSTIEDDKMEEDTHNQSMEQDIQKIINKQAKLTDEQIRESAVEFNINLDDNIQILRQRLDRYLIRKRFGSNSAAWDLEIDGTVIAEQVEKTTEIIEFHEGERTSTDMNLRDPHFEQAGASNPLTRIPSTQYEDFVRRTSQLQMLDDPP